MLENFIYAKEKSLFEEALNNGEVLDEAIVFIEDTKEIWNHGTYFDGNAVDLSNVEKSIQDITTNYVTNQTFTQAINSVNSGLSSNLNNLSNRVGENTSKISNHDTKIYTLESTVDAHGSLFNSKADKTEIPTKVSQLENDVPYIIEDVVNNGLYIYDTDGRFTLPKNWNTTNNSKAVGVAILGDNCKFVVAKENAKSSTVSWGGYGTDIASLTNYSSQTKAAKDFAGITNTQVIIDAIGQTNDGYRTGSAAQDCVDYIFPNGQAGYLGAAGEWKLARSYKDELNSALELIGGTTMTEGYYWASTEYSSYISWGQWFDSNSYLIESRKNYTYYVRAFLAIEVPKPLKEKVSELEISKQDVIKDLETIRSGAAKKMLDNITYSELVTLRDNSQLIPGKQYRITDYITTTTQAETQSAGHQFDVIVIADTVNILNETARITNHEGDTYFANENLAAFQIKYCLDNDISRFSWADTANGKGVIYYMKDQHNNETPYDFKNIQFKRYKVLLNNEYCVDYKSYIENDYVGFKPMNSSGARMHPDLSITDESDFKWYYTFSRLTDETDASINSEGKVHDNVILPVVMDDDNLETLALNNIVLITNMIICENKFNDCCFLMTFIGNGDIGCNYIGSYSIGNILKDCLQNYIGNNFRRNIIISDFTKSNTIGQFFTENIALSRMIARNDFDHGCNNNIFIAIKEITINKFFTECKNNIIVTTGLLNRNHAKAQFSNNVINCSNFITNTIGYGFKSNIITEGNFVQNTIGHNCTNNIFNTFMNSVVNFGFKNNTFKISSDINSENRVRVNDCYFGSIIQYNNFYSTEPNTSDYRIQNLKVQSILQGTSSAINNIEVPCNAINEITVAKDNNNNIIVSNIQSQIGDINTVLESIING